MLGIDSLGIALSAPKFSDTSDNFPLRTLGSTAWGTLLGGCARLMAFWPLQSRHRFRSSDLRASTNIFYDNSTLPRKSQPGRRLMMLSATTIPPLDHWYAVSSFLRKSEHGTLGISEERTDGESEFQQSTTGASGWWQRPQKRSRFRTLLNFATSISPNQPSHLMIVSSTVCKILREP